MHFAGLKMSGNEEIVVISEDESGIVVEVQLLSVFLHKIRTDVAQLFFTVDDDRIVVFQMTIIFH